MDSKDTREKIESVLKLLSQESTTFDKAESVLSLLRGTSPRLDKYIGQTQKALSAVRKLQDGDVIELSAEVLLERTEEEKKRRKALLWFIKNWKDLENETKRVKAEFDKGQGNQTTGQQVASVSKLLTFARGPFGLITIAAVVVVAGLTLTRGQKTSNPVAINSPSPSQNQQGASAAVSSKPSPSASASSKVQAINYKDKKIPMSEIYVGTGPDCDSPHYHAKDHTSAKALDGSTVADPGGCGFGRVKEVQVLEVES